MGRRVFFYVQHLLGVGHVKRASLIARAMAKFGLDVRVVLGGLEVPGIDFAGCVRIPLPPLRAADETIQNLVDEGGEPVSEALWEQRRARLLAELRAFEPSVLLIEQFPFGRRQFRFEILALLATARSLENPPRVASSVRDILVRKTKPERNREMVQWARAHFDVVLVHGDPTLIPLEASFPEARELGSRIRYTGYVVESCVRSGRHDHETGRGEVIVSAGGGAVGGRLLRTALQARPLTSVADRVWRVITGPNLSDVDFDNLAWNAPDGVIINRWRTDLPLLLENCRLSVSQAGYNTIADIVRARARAVVVPFAAEGQTEQSLRARALAKRGVLSMVESKDLSAEALARCIESALADRIEAAEIDLEGAETTARMVAALGRAESAGRA